MKAIRNLCLVEHFHGVYLSIVVDTHLRMKWNECVYFVDTTKASLCNELNALQLLKSDGRLIVGMG